MLNWMHYQASEVKTENSFCSGTYFNTKYWKVCSVERSVYPKKIERLFEIRIQRKMHKKKGKEKGSEFVRVVLSTICSISKSNSDMRRCYVDVWRRRKLFRKSRHSEGVVYVCKVIPPFKTGGCECLQGRYRH